MKSALWFRKLPMILGMVISSLLLSCSMDFYQPVDRQPLLAQDMSLPTTTPSQVLLPHWWESYGSDELNAFIAEAISQNLSLKIAIERVNSARAKTKEVNASRYPSAELGYENTLSNDDEGFSREELFSFTPSLTLDVWGTNYAEYEAANHRYISTQFSAKLAQMTLIEEVVATWIDIKFYQLQQHLLQNQLHAYQAIVAYETQTYDKNTASYQDLLDNQIKVRQYDTLVRKNSIDIDTRINQLTYLLGRNPINNVVVSPEPVRAVAPLPTRGITSSLLQDRPDIQAAWYKLRAADWQLAHSKLQTLPQFSVSVDFSHAALASVFSNWTSVIQNVDYQIMDWGKARAQIDQQTSATQIHLYDYMDTVYKAVLQVQNYMMRDNEYLASLAWNQAKYHIAKSTYDDALQHLHVGGNTAESVLYKYIEFCNTALKVLQEERQLNLNRIALYNAIGGNIWATSSTGSAI